MAYVVEAEDFSHILRLLNTNVDGTLKIVYALTAIKGIGRRFADIICKRAGIDPNKRAGELTKEDLKQIQYIIAQPKNFRIPLYFLNRRRDYKTNKDFHNWKKTRRHRGLRHLWQLKCRGQRTKTTGHGQGCLGAFHLGPVK